MSILSVFTSIANTLEDVFHVVASLFILLGYLIGNILIFVWTLGLPNLYEFIVIYVCKFCDLQIFVGDEQLHFHFPMCSFNSIRMSNNPMETVNYTIYSSNRIAPIYDSGLHELKTIYLTLGRLSLTGDGNNVRTDGNNVRTYSYINTYNNLRDGEVTHRTALYDIAINNSRMIKYLCSVEIHEDLWNMYILGPFSLIYIWYALFKFVQYTREFDMVQLTQLREPILIEYAELMNYNFTLIEQFKADNLDRMQTDRARELYQPSPIPPIVQWHRDMTAMDANDIEIVLK